jgi:4-hydroxythreonine-4-phosphate dehydrogenase
MLNIGITLGDPAGIGPEIVAKSINSIKNRSFRVTLFGDRENFRETLKQCGLNMDGIKNVDFINTGNGNRIEQGRVTAQSGRIAYDSIRSAVEFAMAGRIDAMATAPINKEAIMKAGSEYIDHTSMLKGLTNSRFITTLFEVKKLRITFLSKHVSLLDAVKYVKKENVYSSIADTCKSMKLLGFPDPEIAVAALNPHAGESGMFGREEIDEIIPAVEKARETMKVYGPVPADSVFYQASRGKYDVVLSLYHDQGHIAAKTYDFKNTVSMNIGLPFLRTSVDHGTAFDIAGKNQADYVSMKAAIMTAARYAPGYRKRLKTLKF